jgi:hypothetical protein
MVFFTNKEARTSSQKYNFPLCRLANRINGSLVVAPDFFIRNQIELLKTLVSYCEIHTVLFLCPVPRYTTSLL